MIFLLLLGAHFIFLVLIFAPTSKLLYLWNRDLQMISPEQVPQPLKQLDEEKDLVPSSVLKSTTTFDRLSTTLLEWRRDRFMKPDEKMAFDLSTLNYGKGIIGLNAASEYYFKKPLEEISPEQWIVLVNFNRIFKD